MVCDSIHDQAVCSDESSMWTCKDGSTCIHKSLLCDGHPQCPDSSDEGDICYYCPIQGGSSDKTYQCTHRLTGLPICASPCDGVYEMCQDNSDEQNCSTEMYMSFALTLICLIIVFAPLAVEIITKIKDGVTGRKTPGRAIIDLNFMNDSSMKFLQAFIQQDDQDKVKDSWTKVHSESADDKFTEELKIIIAVINNLTDAMKIKFYQLELNHHDANEFDMHMCIFKTMGTCQSSDDFLVMKKGSKWYSLTKWFQKLGWSMNALFYTKATLGICKYLFMIVSYYVDLIKDFVLFYLLVSFVPIFHTGFFTISFQLVFTTGLTFFIPQLLNFIFILTQKNERLPNILNFKYQDSIMLGILNCLLILIFMPFLPGMSIYQILRSKLELLNSEFTLHNTACSMDNDDPDAQRWQLRIEARNYLTLSDQALKDQRFLISIRRNENVIEHFFQIVLITLITHSLYSSTGTVSILHHLIGESNSELVIISGLWSIRSLISGHIQVTKASKNNFLPTLGKLLIMVYFAISVFVRLAAIVMFFVPSLGLFGVLNHWKYGKIPGSALGSVIYDVTFDQLRNPYPIYFDNVWIPMNNFEELTGLSIRRSYIIILVGILLHYGIVYMIMSPLFK